MKQRVIALLLVLVIVSAIVVSAVAEEPAAAGEDTTITVVKAQAADEKTNAEPTAATAVQTASTGADRAAGAELQEATAEMLLFTQLEELVKKNNLSYKSLGMTADAMDDLEKSADSLESGIAQLKQQIAALDPVTDAAAIANLQTQLAEMQQGLSSISSMVQDTTQMEAGCKQLILGAQKVFIALVGMEQQEAALERQLAALDRTVKEMELRADMGQISQLQLLEVKSGRESLVSGLATLRMNISNYKMQLEQMVGRKMTGKVQLGTLPAVTAEELNAIDLEADLKVVLRKSVDVQAANASVDQLDNAAMGASGVSSALWDLRDAADYTVKETKQQVELKFRMLYAQLQDDRQVIAASESALKVRELACQAAELKYQQGAISKNELLTAEDELKTAQDTLQTAKHDLFSTYNDYCWAVKHGVLS